MIKRLVLILAILLTLASPSYALVGAKGGTAFTGGDVGAIDEFRMLLGDYRYGAIFIPEAEPFKVN